MSEQWLAPKLNCTYEDKMECIKNISSVLEWIRECIQHKNFDFEIVHNSNALFKKAVSLIYSGESQEHIFNIMYNYVITWSINSKEFLENISILSIILCFLKSDNYYDIVNLVSSYYGLEFDSYFQNIYEQYDKIYESPDDTLKYLSNTLLYSENTAKLEFFKEYENNEIHFNVILNTYYRIKMDSFVSALSGSSGEVKIFLLNQLPLRLKNEIAIRIKYEINSGLYETGIVYNQNKFLNCLLHLEDKGSIKRELMFNHKTKDLDLDSYLHYI